MSYVYKTHGTCASQIELELEGNIVHNVKFTGGCHGNLQAIPKLVEGLTVEEVEKIVDRFSKAIKDQLGDDVDITFMAESCDNMFCRYCQDEGCDHRAVGFVDIKYLGIDTVIKNDTHYLKAVRGRNERISDTKDEGKNGE